MNKTILPSIGIVTADDPATYLITPFQDGTAAYLAFLKAATHTVRIMIYGFTLAPVVDALIAQKAAGLDVKLILHHTQAMGHAEKPQLERMVAGGFVDGRDFLVGTSPEHHAINHLKATWTDQTMVFQGSWNYSLSATQELNAIEIVQAPALAATFDSAFAFAWQWILAHEAAYQTFTAHSGAPDSQ